jgi:hypothetical protein
MRAAAGNRNQAVPRDHGAAVDNRRFLYHADAEAGEVVVLTGIHARHLRGLSADQGAAGQFASAADTFDHGGGGVHVQFSGGIIIEKEEGFGAGDHQVVHTHCHQVDADAVVDTQIHGQSQLGADAVSAGYQYGFPVAGRDFA